MGIDTIIMLAAIIYFLIIPSLKDRTVSVKKLVITPVVFLSLFYQTMTEKFGMDPTSLAIVGAGLLAGITLGILLRKNTPIKADKNTVSIGLPGSYVNLIMFIIIFSVHYIIGYQEAVNPAFFQQISGSYYFILFALALASTVSAGMSLCLFYKYRAAA